MTTYSYSVRDIRRLVRESSNEFKAKIGANVEADNKRNNDKSYKESDRRVKDYNAKAKTPVRVKPTKVDNNRTTLDYTPSNEPDEKFKKKVEVQAQGYTSELEKKNGIEKGGADFDDKGEIAKAFNDSRNKAEKNKKEIQKAGLTARELPDNLFNKNHLNETAKPKTKRLIFKHSRFVNESQVLNRVPEEYKVDGQRIIMTDVANNEYIVECIKSEASGLIETSIVSYKNDRVMNEQVNRIHELMNYKSSDEFGLRTPKDKLNEETEFKKIMDIARGQK